MACRTGCPTQDHENWGECLRASNLEFSTGDANSAKGMTEKKWNAELNAYAAARAQGIQPAGTSMAKIKDAVEKSDKAGKAFDANTGTFKG
ncbi:MAG: hypothetical protein EBZ61_09190 [Micrococcales bacterium]|jgi:hypothetical protein|nr:hypothetical protein [Micrococcales bacterium]